MFRRSLVIFAASLALLSTLDSATCFAAAAPAQPRDDVDRPRFIRKEIKRFVFSNTTRSEPPNEASTSDLEALHDSLTSSSSQDLGPDATPTSATSASTITPSVTLAEIGQSSTSDVSMSAAGDSDIDREASLALQSSTTTSPVSSALPPSSSPNGEGATTQSSVIPGADTDVARSSQSLPLSSLSPPDQTTANGVVPQTTQPSTAEQFENSLTLSQPASTAQPATSAFTSSTATPKSQGNLQDNLDIAQEPSSSIPSQASVSSSGEQGPSTLGLQTSSSPSQQTDTQVQSDTTQGTSTLQSGASSEGTGTPPSTTSIAGSSSAALPVGETIASSSGRDDGFTGAVTTANEGPGSVPTTLAGVGSSTVITPAGTKISSNANDEADQLTTTGVNVATQGLNSPSETTAGVVSSAVVPPAGTTIISNANEESERLSLAVTSATGRSESAPMTSVGAASSAVIRPAEATTSSSANDEANDLTLGSATATARSSLGGEVTSGVPALSTNTGSEDSANTNTIVSQVVPGTLGSGAGAVTTHAAEPASSPVAPQSAVPATGTSLGSETGQGTVGSEGSQPTVTPTVGAGQTSQDIGLPASSASVALQSNAAQTVSQAAASPPQTTLSNGAVVPNTAQITATPLVTPSVSVPSPGVPQTASPSVNAGATEPASVANPSLAEAASILNTIPASIENPLASVSGSSPLVFNPAFTSAAAALATLPASVQNPVAPVGSPNPTSPVISGGSSLGNTAVGSPITPGSSIEGPESSEATATGSPASGTALPLGTTEPQSPISSSVGGSVLPFGSSESQRATGSSGEPTAGQGSGQNPQNTATGSVVPQSGPTSASSGEVISGTPASNLLSATPESGVTGYSTQSDGKVVPVSVSAGKGSTLSNGQIVPAATDTKASVQQPEPSETGAVASSSAAAVAAGSTQGNAATPASNLQSATPESGVTGYSTQSNGKVVPVSVSAGKGSTLSNGQIVPAATDTKASVQQPEPSETGAVVSSSAAAVAAGSTQGNAATPGVTATPTSPSPQSYSGSGSYTQSLADTVSNGQTVPTATDHGAPSQQPGPSETGAVVSSSAAAQSVAAQSAAAQSAAAQSAAAGSTQSNAATPGVTATPASPSPQSYSGSGPYTQSPVGYDTSTAQPVPTSIIHAPSSTPSATQGHYFGPSSLPSNVPQILYQNGGPGSQPPNTRLINIAFRYPLNYLFVYNNTDSQKQIFKYIPLGISYGLEIDIGQIRMQSLRAWDTYEDVGYVTTLALAWIPEGLVDNLALLVSTPVSRFYHNPDNSTAFLLSMINNAIPITGSNGTDGGSTTFGNIPPDTTSAKTAGAPIGGDIGNSEHVRASSVGIGVGVACGAAAYGAAMFFVARRYKKRRLSHTRSPSMFSSPVMSHAGPDTGAGAALMSGAMGERSASPYYDNDGRAGSRGSGRSGSSRHQISAPVMAENSLGWN